MHARHKALKQRNAHAHHNSSYAHTLVPANQNACPHMITSMVTRNACTHTRARKPEQMCLFCASQQTSARALDTDAHVHADHKTRYAHMQPSQACACTLTVKARLQALTRIHTCICALPTAAYTYAQLTNQPPCSKLSMSRHVQASIVKAH
jgi:hypothetical protein